MEITQKIYDAILNGDKDTVEITVTDALQNDIPPKVILEEGMISAMAKVGEMFEQGDFFVPEMLISARAMKSGLVLLKPHLKGENATSKGKVAIGTVKGDLHDIGKGLVSMMLEGAGYEIIDLGTDVDPEKFVSIADQVDVIALSALLTTTMGNMKSTIEALNQSGKRGTVKVIIGGAPVTEAFANQIGADGYALDASRAVKLVQLLVG
jgi:5-methyltetrahydrofolate--homocysteine methyltransferase